VQILYAVFPGNFPYRADLFGFYHPGRDAEPDGAEVGIALCDYPSPGGKARVVRYSAGQHDTFFLRPDKTILYNNMEISPSPTRWYDP